MQPTILPLTGLPTGEVPPSVIVCGDPARANQIASQFDESKKLSEKREYRCFVGSFWGESVAVCSHGIGSPGAAIAFEELISAGAERIIRVGTCGGLQPDINSGHIVVASAAVQNIGFGSEFLPNGYPAAADVETTYALTQTASRSSFRWSAGIVLTRDCFYQGVNVSSTPDYEQMSKANVLAVEMECAALFIVAALRKVKAAAILSVDGNVLIGNGESMERYDPDNKIVSETTFEAADIALKTLAHLNDVSS